eukprot:jgi/Psemu1/282328/fgenesh1_pg.6_\
MPATLNTFYSNHRALLGSSVDAFTQLFPPDMVWWVEPADGLSKMAAKASVMNQDSTMLQKTIKRFRVTLKSATLAPAASTLINELLETSDYFAQLAWSTAANIKDGN